MEANFVPGKKLGSKYLVDPDNYLYSRVYNKQDDSGGTRTLWRCIVNNVPKCPATATTNKPAPEEQEIFKGRGKTEHNHVPDLSKPTKLKEVAKVKDDGLGKEPS